MAFYEMVGRAVALMLAGASVADISASAQAIDAPTAATPPMGWNPYNVFDLEYGEAEVMEQADLLARLGLADLGYRYINIDDGWWLKRADGTIHVRTSLYPSARMPDSTTSLRPFVDRLHAMGLKAGIYTDIGRNSCSQRFRPNTPNLPEGSVAEREVGTYGHHSPDAALMLARWGFDLIKVDACGVADFGANVLAVKEGRFRAFPPLIVRERPAVSDAVGLAREYASFADAVRKATPGRRPIISICAWGQADSNDWAHHYSQMWRTSADINAKWDAMLFNFDSAASRSLFAGPGRWNDPDMLEVGNGDFDSDHLVAARAHMSLWSILAAPLILGNDLRRLTPGILEIIANQAMISINQDPAGNQGVVVSRSGDGQVVAKALKETGRKAIALINRGRKPLKLSTYAADLGLSPTAPMTVSNVWTGELVRPANGRITVALAPQETALLLVKGRPLEAGVSLPADIPARFSVADIGYKAPDRSPSRQWVLAQIGYLPNGEPLMLDGSRDFAGLGVAAGSHVGIDLDRQYRRVRLDPRTLNTENGQFVIIGDGKILRKGTATMMPQPLVIDVRKVRRIELIAPSATKNFTKFVWHKLKFER